MVKRSEPKRYEVEVILAARVDRNGCWEYLVKWSHWSEFWNSWEPAQNVKDCHERLRAFWEHFDAVRPLQDFDKTYDPGFVFGASTKWIKGQKALAAREEDLRHQLGGDDVGPADDPLTILLPPISRQLRCDTEKSYVRLLTIPPEPSVPTLPYSPPDDECRLPASSEIKVPRKRLVLKQATTYPGLRRPTHINGTGGMDFHPEGRISHICDAPPSPSSLFSRSPSPGPPALRSYKPHSSTKTRPLPIETYASVSSLSSKHRIARMVAPNVSLFAASATEGESIPEPSPALLPDVSEAGQNHEGWEQPTDSLASNALWQDPTVEWGDF